MTLTTMWTRVRCRTPRPPFLSSRTRSISTTDSLRTFIRPSRSLRQELAPPTPDATFYEKIGVPGVRRQIFFVTVTCSLALTLGALETTTETEYWKDRMVSLSPVWTVKSLTNTDIKRAQNAEFIQGLRDSLANIQSTVQQLPMLIRPWINLACVAVMQPYADASEGKRLCWKICLLNAAVWAAWKFKRLQPLMARSFMHYPLSGLSYTMLTSTFSHRSAMHLLFNCLALESFGSAAYYYLLREQNKAEPDLLESTTSFHFLAFFVSAGIFSSLISHIVNAKIRFPRLISQLALPAGTTSKAETWAGALASTTKLVAHEGSKKSFDILPSLGASGAIYAAVTMTALAFPESQVALFIPPTYPVNIQYGVGGLLLLDAVGIIRGWRFFDHWAHLGGAAFGIFYFHYGPRMWRQLRANSTEALHNKEQ